MIRKLYVQWLSSIELLVFFRLLLSNLNFSAQIPSWLFDFDIWLVCIQSFPQVCSSSSSYLLWLWLLSIFAFNIVVKGYQFHINCPPDILHNKLFVRKISLTFGCPFKVFCSLQRIHSSTFCDCHPSSNWFELLLQSLLYRDQIYTLIKLLKLVQRCIMTHYQFSLTTLPDSNSFCF